MLVSAPPSPHGTYRVTLPFSSDELAVVDTVVSELLEEARIDGPPIDTFELANRLDFSVGWDDCQRGRGRCVHLKGSPGSEPTVAALLRSDPRPERNQWALAHEIGEQAASRVFARLDMHPAEAPPARREAVANCMAGRLLVPSAWFAEDGRLFGWDLFELKSRYATASHELIARRMLACDPPIVIGVYDHGGLTWRQSNAGYPPPVCPDEETARHSANETSATASYGGVTAWPVHEPGWKREITRMTLPDAFF